MTSAFDAKEYIANVPGWFEEIKAFPVECFIYLDITQSDNDQFNHLNWNIQLKIDLTQIKLMTPITIQCQVGIWQLINHRPFYRQTSKSIKSKASEFFSLLSEGFWRRTKETPNWRPVASFTSTSPLFTHSLHLTIPIIQLAIIALSIQNKYVFSRVGKTLPTPQLLGHWATAPIALWNNQKRRPLKLIYIHTVLFCIVVRETLGCHAEAACTNNQVHSL